MAVGSVLDVDSTRFDQEVISADRKKFNDGLNFLMAQEPRWYEVSQGAATLLLCMFLTRAPRSALKNTVDSEQKERRLSAATLLETAEQTSRPSRDPGRRIPCRVLCPQKYGSTIKAVYMHVHGGGWVLQSEQSCPSATVLLQNIHSQPGLTTATTPRNGWSITRSPRTASLSHCSVASPPVHISVC